MGIYTFLFIVGAVGLATGALFGRGRRQIWVLEGVGLLAAVALTLYGVAHADDPDCRECGGGFFAGLFSAVGFVLWSGGVLIGALSRRLSDRLKGSERRP
ncbi:MAG: hypothetical protein H0W90_08840 [Actinobacteria bacterium]|nr:hypothetical protein [Actinomycetota bacterium]